MIKLYKYFFEPNEYDETPQRVGNTQRGRKGKIFTDYSSDEYKTINMTIDNLTEKEHFNLVFITSLVFPTDGGGQDLSFTNPMGESFTVTIPNNGYDYSIKNTEEDLYKWEITLEEVI